MLNFLKSKDATYKSKKAAYDKADKKLSESIEALLACIDFNKRYKSNVTADVTSNYNAITKRLQLIRDEYYQAYPAYKIFVRNEENELKQWDKSRKAKKKQDNKQEQTDKTRFPLINFTMPSLSLFNKNSFTMPSLSLFNKNSFNDEVYELFYKDLPTKKLQFLQTLNKVRDILFRYNYFKKLKEMFSKHHRLILDTIIEETSREQASSDYGPAEHTYGSGDAVGDYDDGHHYGGKRKSKKKQYYNIKKGRRTFHNTRHSKSSYYMMGGGDGDIYDEVTAKEAKVTHPRQLINRHYEIWKITIEKADNRTNCETYIAPYELAKQEWDNAKSELVEVTPLPSESPPIQAVEEVPPSQSGPPPTQQEEPVVSPQTESPRTQVTNRLGDRLKTISLLGGKSRRKKSRKTKSRKRKAMKRRR
jgi:hypothetical protein